MPLPGHACSHAQVVVGAYNPNPNPLEPYGFNPRNPNHPNPCSHAQVVGGVLRR